MRAFSEGRQAYFDGKGGHLNHYDTFSKEWLNWQKGYIGASISLNVNKNGNSVTCNDYNITLRTRK